MPQTITYTLQETFSSTKWVAIRAGMFLGVLLLVWILLQVNRRLFNRLQQNRSGLQLQFFERTNVAVILVGGTILAFSVFGGIGSVWKTLLGGTAIISAVIAFAAQDIIRDLLAGFMITLYKPFEIGNRVLLEDGTVGIILEITMRHVVLRGMESQRIVIPNSRLNSMVIRNFSFHSEYRSAQFDFHVSYDTDVDRAMETIRGAVIASPYSIPALQTEAGEDYSPVYFMAFEESSLRFSTTVYFDDKVLSEAVISDINTRVMRALHKAGIEVPYPFVNVVRRN